MLAFFNESVYMREYTNAGGDWWAGGDSGGDGMEGVSEEGG